MKALGNSRGDLKMYNEQKLRILWDVSGEFLSKFKKNKYIPTEKAPLGPC